MRHRVTTLTNTNGTNTSDTGDSVTFAPLVRFGHAGQSSLGFVFFLIGGGMIIVPRMWARAQWQDRATSRAYVFVSRNIGFDPTQYIQGKSVKVYMARGNPKKYYVDLSFLAELAS